MQTEKVWFVVGLIANSMVLPVMIHSRQYWTWTIITIAAIAFSSWELVK